MVPSKNHLSLLSFPDLQVFASVLEIRGYMDNLCPHRCVVQVLSYVGGVEEKFYN